MLNVGLLDLVECRFGELLMAGWSSVDLMAIF